MAKTVILALLAAAVFSFFPSVLSQGTCYNCHAQQDPALSAPSKEVAEGRHSNLACPDCHDEHEGVLRKLSSAQNIEVCALRCHESTIPFYHGKSIRIETPNALVGERAVLCTSCHEAHATRGSNDTLSWTYRVNIPQTCAGRSLECHASAELARRYEILNAYPGYLASGHGRTQAVGYKKAAVCVDCHAPNSTAHINIVEKNNTLSSIHLRNREKTCTQKGCHVGSGVKVGWGSMHGRSEYSLLGMPIESYIDWFYESMIVVFVGGAVFFVVLDFSRRIGGRL